MATEVYVDPAINANSGAGTIGDPYGDLQYALNTVTRDGTNGNRFNIKAGTAEILTAALSLGTYGTPTVAAPLIFQGYTSAAGDGGIGEISGNGSYGVFTTSGQGFTRWFDLKMGNCGGNLILHAGTNTLVRNCEIHTNTTHGVALTSGSSQFCDSWIHDTRGSYAINIAGLVQGCFIDQGSGASTFGIDGSTGSRNGNLVRGYANGINVGQGESAIGNTVIGVTTASARGLVTGFYSVFINNLVTGYSGSGAIGINAANSGNILINNAFWNNTTNISGTKNFVTGTVTLAGDPFVDTSQKDYSTSEASLLVAVPSLFRGTTDGGASGTTNAAYIGAVQASGGGGGGGASFPLIGPGGLVY
jgi:hypothetical protein